MHITINQRIILVGLLPLIALVVILITNIWQDVSRANVLSRINPIAELAREGGDVVHMLQPERGSSVGFLSAGLAGNSDAVSRFRGVLDKRRSLTNDELAQLRDLVARSDWATIDQSLDRQITDMLAALNGLDSMRANVDAASVAPPDAVGFYTPIIYQLIGIITRMSQVVEDPELASMLTAYRALVLAKEKAGLERAMGSNLFNRGEFVPALFNRFMLQVHQQQAYLADFRAFARSEDQSLFDNTVTGRDVDQVAAWRDVLTMLGSTNDTQGISGADWFAKTTTRIDLMKQVEDDLADALAETIQAKLDEAWQRVSLSAIATTLIVLLVSIVIFFAIRSVTVPLRAAIGALAHVSSGQTEIELPGLLKRNDEFGQIGNAITGFMASQTEVQRAQEETERLRERSELALRDALMDMANKVEGEAQTAVDVIEEGSQELGQSAASLLSGAEKVGENAADVRGSADEAMHYAETVASASEELSASIGAIDEQIVNAQAITAKAADSGKQTEEIVSHLREEVDRIGTVASLISDVAEQTNLLALNATIEAARAGEAGKGFAVVANEVKNLANQTARSTDEITKQINEVQAITVKTVDSVNAIIGDVNAIDETTRYVADAISQQGEATREISKSINDAAGAARRVSEKISDVSDEADRASHSAGSVGEVARKVQTQISSFQSSLIKIVRSSSSYVDRRENERFPVTLQVQIELTGEHFNATTVDISKKGTQVISKTTMRIGDHGRVSFKDFGGSYRFVVRSTNDEGYVSLDFEPSDTETIRTQLAPWLMKRFGRV